MKVLDRVFKDKKKRSIIVFRESMETGEVVRYDSMSQAIRENGLRSQSPIKSASMFGYGIVLEDGKAYAFHVSTDGEFVSMLTKMKHRAESWKKCDTR